MHSHSGPLMSLHPASKLGVHSSPASKLSAVSSLACQLRSTVNGSMKQVCNVLGTTFLFYLLQPWIDRSTNKVKWVFHHRIGGWWVFCYSYSHISDPESSNSQSLLHYGKAYCAARAILLRVYVTSVHLATVVIQGDILIFSKDLDSCTWWRWHQLAYVTSIQIWSWWEPTVNKSVSIHCV